MESQKESHPQYIPYPPHQTQTREDTVELIEVFTALWKKKWVIISVTLVSAISSVLFALSLPNMYKADAILSPTESASGGGLSQMAGQLGGLAALAGVNIGGAESSNTDLAIQVLKSRQFINSFIKKHDLLVPLMAVSEWNLEQNTLVINEDVYDQSKKEWLRAPQGLRGATPTAQEAYEEFVKNVLIINQDKETGFYTLSIKHYSPYIAQEWLNWIIADLNKVMRERAISETSQNLAYLNEQLQKTAVADMQSAFYKLIEEQTKSLMLAEVQEEFVFKVVDPAVVPEIKDGPNRALICMVGTFLGGLLSVGIVLVLFMFERNRKVSITNR